MIGSIFAAFLYGGNLNNQQPPTPPVDNGQTTAVDFEATSIPAKVVRLFPTIVVTVPTSQTDITALDSKLVGVSGVIGLLGSRFSQSSDPNSGFVYVAELSISADENTSDLRQRITVLEGFQNADVIRAGFVSLPERVTFTNALGLTQEHVFESAFSNAYLSTQTLPDDNVEVFLQASLAANSLQSIIAIEEKNITASPKQVSINQALSISLLEPELFATFVGNEHILAQGAISLLEEEMKNTLLDSNSASVSLGFFFPTLEITLDKNYSNFEEDFKTVLNDFNGVVDFDLALDENMLSVYLEQNTFLEIKQKILDEFAALNFGVLESRGPRVPIEATIGFSSTSLSENSAKLSEFLSSKSFSDTNIFQKASFTETSFTDSNSIYALEEGNFSAFILPTHTNGETVDLLISFIAVRGKIISISAREK